MSIANQFKYIVLAAIVGLSAWGPAISIAPAAELPEKIETGPADENAETSSAIMLILDNCAKAYASTKVMHATGTFVQANKADEETTYLSAKVTLNYINPGKLAIVSTSDQPSLDKAFYANGTTTTHVSTADKEYLQLPQPPLDAYAGSYRAGEIYNEFSGALALSGTGSLLISADPLGWIHEGVVRYVYEGEEETGGAKCHRIRFNQEDPEAIVILWIDKENWLIRKVSFISSFDEDYNMVESFEAGKVASMRLMTWDKISTKKSDIPKNAFDAKIPKGFKVVEDKPRVKDENAGRGFWGSLVGLAAKESKEETTWSLTRQSGSVNLRLEQFVETQTPATDVDPAIARDGKSSALGLAMEDGAIHYYTNDGTLSSTVKLPEKLSMFAYMDTKSSGPLLVVTDKDQQNLTAYNLAGQRVWNYSHPYTQIDSIRGATPPESDVYVDLGSHGLRKLDENGKVQVANTKLTHTGMVTPAPPGTDRIVLRTSLWNISVVDKQLKPVQSFDTDEAITSVSWDEETSASPLLCLAVTDDSDVLLQRRALNGDIAWTTMIEPKSENGAGVSCILATVNVDGKPQECPVILMADGQIAIASKDGKVIYRGKVKANDALIEQNEGYVVNYFLVCDINNDGLDEIYFPLNTHMMRLVSQ